METFPTWIGDEPLAGFIHCPAGRVARGAVLMCSSLGAEHAWSYRGMRETALRLTGAGLVVLRFDYAGTGQSGGDQERLGLDGLRRSIGRALDLLADIYDGPTGALTFGVGALLLGSALADRGPLDCVALWEPPASGRRWLREQNALLRVGASPGALTPDGEPGIEVPGLLVSEQLRRELGSLRLRPGPDWAARALTVARAASSSVDATADYPLEWQPADDTDELLFRTGMPSSSIDTLVQWLSEHAGAGEPLEVRLPALRSEAELCSGSTGPIQERFVHVGDTGMFAVRTGPAGGGGDHDPVIFLTTATEPTIGPGRMWVHLARRLAAEGRTAFRLDLPGFGDSPPHEAQPPDTTYPPQAAQDVMDAISEITGGNTSRATVIGMCSGGYHALRAADRLPLKQVCAVNPVFSAPGRSRWARSGSPAPGPRAPIPERAASLARELTGTAAAVVPALRRRLSVALRLWTATRTGTRLSIVCAADEARSVVRRGGPILKSLEASGSVRVVPIEDAGHAVLTGREQQAVLEAVHAELSPRAGAGAGRPAGRPAGSVAV